ncbi:MAG: hypothetical protein ABEH86_00290 [Haloarcula sp.]
MEIHLEQSVDHPDVTTEDSAYSVSAVLFGTPSSWSVVGPCSLVISSDKSRPVDSQTDPPNGANLPHSPLADEAPSTA